jgi:hypothetical protein
MKSNGRRIEPLRERWLASGSFVDEQAYLAARVQSGNVRFVFLDPDGTLESWLAVVVGSQTGVVYATQCEGVATKQRFVEGYLVLLGGSKYDPDGGMIDPAPLTEVFHKDGACIWSWQGRELPGERFAKLDKLIEEIPYWRCGLDGSDDKCHLRIDKDRVEQVAEAWIPVETPDGPGVLLYKNCD